MAESTTAEQSAAPSIIEASKDFLDGPTSLPPPSETATPIDPPIIQTESVPIHSLESSNSVSDTIPQDDSTSATLPNNFSSPRELSSDSTPAPPLLCTESHLSSDSTPAPPLLCTESHLSPDSTLATTLSSSESRPLPFSVLPADLIPFTSILPIPSVSVLASSQSLPQTQTPFSTLTAAVDDPELLPAAPLKTANALRRSSRELSGSTEKRHVHFIQMVNNEGSSTEPVERTEHVAEAEKAVADAESAAVAESAADAESASADVLDAVDKGSKSVPTLSLAAEVGMDALLDEEEDAEDDGDCVLEAVTYAKTEEEEAGGAEPVPVRKASEAQGAAFMDDVCVIEDDMGAGETAPLIKRSRLTPLTPLGTSAAFTSFEHAQHAAANLKELTQSVVRIRSLVLVTRT